MHSTHGRSRHRHREDDDDELPLTVSRVDDRRPDSYSRSHNYSARSETRTTSSRLNYSNSSSRSQRPTPEDWRTVDTSYSSSNHDRYRDDGYSHSRRDEYFERPEPRSADPWPSRSVDEVQYPSSSRDWTKHGEVGYSSTYSESRSWTVPERYEENGRNGLDDWSREDTRKERDKGRYERDDGYAAAEPSWRTSDEGWLDESSRDRRASTWTERPDDRGYWRTSSHDRDIEKNRDPQSIPVERDRQWEPAPTWRSREWDVEPSTRTHPPHRNSKKLAKSKGKKSQQNEPKKDKRRDDAMNNWQKREIRPAGREKEYSRPSTKRKQENPRSPSPALTSYSRHSHPRSRSRSVSPRGGRRWNEGKRDRREPSPPRTRDISEPGHTSAWTYSPSTPLPPRVVEDTRGRPRRPSTSSRSTKSRSRSSGSGSVSDSPESRKKAKHRLPTATSLLDIELQAKSLTRLTVSQKNEINASRNGKSGKAARKAERRAAAIQAENTGIESNRSQISRETMLPPPEPTPASNSNRLSFSKPTAVAVPEVVPLRAQQSSSKKSAGFKPIGQSNAAIKRFFPGDDDDSDFNVTETIPESDSRPSVTTPPDTVSTSQEPRSNGRTYRNQQNHRPSRETPLQPHGHGSEFPSPSPGLDRSLTPSEIVPLSAASYTKRGHHAKRAKSPRGETRVRDIVPVREQSEDGEEKTPPGHIAEDRSEVYDIVSQVGEGTFGKVYKARNTVTGRLVALKRIRMEAERDGFPVTAMRETKLLQSLNHLNVVQLAEMMVHHGSVYMVFEYMDHDLTGVLSQTQFIFSDGHLKSFCQQLLHGLAYLHRKGVIHRDIKGSNILINNRGELKLGDFGLARFYQKRRRSDYTNRVITLWYRPPELLLGTTVYGPEVDMWSAGCIMLELFCKKPVFQGNDEIHQLHVIYKVLGTPTPNEWPGIVDMPWYELVKPREIIRNRFRELFNKWLSPAGLDLAEQLLAFDPLQRVSAEQALEAPYFKLEAPPSVKPDSLSTLEGEWHEYESKLERAKKRRKVESAPAPESSEPAQQ